MNQLNQIIQNYIKTLYANGASKNHELTCLIEQATIMANRFNEKRKSANLLSSKETTFYTDWLLSEIKIIQPTTLENSILILIHIIDKLLMIS